jgi:hypothetical protein
LAGSWALSRRARSRSSIGGTSGDQRGGLNAVVFRQCRKCGGQAAPGSMKPYGDGRLGATERTGDLPAVEVVPDRQEQDLSIGLGQERQRSLDRFAYVRFDGARLLCRLLVEQPFRQRFLPKCSAPDVEPHISRDSDEPGPLLVRHRVEPAPGDQKRLGDHVVRDLWITAPRVPADGFDVLGVEQVEPFFSSRDGFQRRPPGG